ncbi:MAG: phosphatase PAP2 family protein [Oscillibacter sp.]|nr:phosphatase PAP2 family protein [Oscillibacter sp.]
MQGFELAVLDGIQGLRCGWLDAVVVFVSWLGNNGLIWILLAAVLLALRKQRRTGLCVCFGLVLDLLLCNLLLKPLIGRGRPFLLRPELVLLVPPPGDASFPSGHTAAGFAAVLALWGAGSPLWRPALGLAAVMGFSRLYLYVHWPSDVLGGVLVGGVAGWAGALLIRRVCKRK